MSEGHRMVTEQVYVPWYEWECEGLGSCHNAFANYVNYYMLPQVLVLAIAMFLQVEQILILMVVLWCKFCIKKFVGSEYNLPLEVYGRHD